MSDGKYTLRKILLLMYFMTNETPIQINRKLLNKMFRNKNGKYANERNKTIYE